MQAAGLEQRSMLEIGKNVPVPDGVYYEGRADRIVVWVPPDPAKTYGRTRILPRAIELRLVPGETCRRLDIRSVTAPSTRAAVLGLSVITIVVVLAVLLSGMWPAAVVLAMPLFIVWFLVRQQLRVAREREALAWTALAPVVGSLPKPETEALDPYRG